MKHLIDQWGEVIEVKGEMRTSFPYTSHPTVSTVSASTFRDRLGGCYVLSGRAVAFEAMGDLVHGSIEGGGHPRNPHAWVVLPNGDIHDPVMDTTMTAPMWEAFANPIEEVRYTPAQVNSIIADTGHWGPWHTTGSLAVADGGVRRSASAWRGFSDSPIWREHDAVILTQFRGRQRYFEVYVRGELVGTFPTLAAAREQMWVWYGDSLDWQRRTMPKVEVLHYWFGWTDEFTDPLTVYVTKVPSLLSTSSTSSDRDRPMQDEYSSLSHTQRMDLYRVEKRYEEAKQQFLLNPRNVAFKRELRSAQYEVRDIRRRLGLPTGERTSSTSTRSSR